MKKINNILKATPFLAMVVAAIWVMSRKWNDAPVVRKVFIIGTDTVIVENGIVVAE